MPTLIPFTPAKTAPFQFQATLDGNVYNVRITWSLAGQRYYANIYDLSGALIVSIPCIGAPDDFDISLTAGFFDSTLIFRTSSQTFEISP